MLTYPDILALTATSLPRLLGFADGSFQRAREDFGFLGALDGFQIQPKHAWYQQVCQLCMDSAGLNLPEVPAGHWVHIPPTGNQMDPF